MVRELTYLTLSLEIEQCSGVLIIKRKFSNAFNQNGMVYKQLSQSLVTEIVSSLMQMVILNMNISIN